MDLDPLSRTALVPFWARAHDALSARPVLDDGSAAALAPRVRELFGEVAVDRSTRVGCCLRNLIVDRWLTDLVDVRTAIVEIGVGLNTRVHRLPSTASQYIEIDHEQVMAVRNDLVPGQGSIRVAGDGMDITRWTDALDSARTERVVITLEGVLVYQQSEAVARFFVDAARAFPGAYVLFDRLSPSAVTRANRPEARDGGRPEFLWPPSVGSSGSGEEPFQIVQALSFMALPRALRRHLPACDRISHALPPRRDAYKLLLCQLAPV
jgi:O-methyltransferase